MNSKLCVIPLILIGTLKTILNSVIGVLMISLKYILYAIGKKTIFFPVKNETNVIKFL